MTDKTLKEKKPEESTPPVYDKKAIQSHIHQIEKGFRKRYDNLMQQIRLLIENINSIPEAQVIAEPEAQVIADARSLIQELSAYTNITDKEKGDIYFASNALGWTEDINRKLKKLEKTKRSNTKAKAKPKAIPPAAIAPPPKENKAYTSQNLEKTKQLLTLHGPQKLDEIEQTKTKARDRITHDAESLQTNCIVWIDEIELRLLQQTISEETAAKFRQQADALLVDLLKILDLTATESRDIQTAQAFAQEIVAKLFALDQIEIEKIPEEKVVKKSDEALDTYVTEFDTACTRLEQYVHKYDRDHTDLLNFHGEIFPLYNQLIEILENWQARSNAIKKELDYKYFATDTLRGAKYRILKLESSKLYIDIIAPLKDKDVKDKKDETASLDALQKLFQPFKK